MLPSGILPVIPKAVRSLSSKTFRHPKGKSRVFPPRKAFCFSHYRTLLETSPIVLFIQHSNFTANQLSKLRRNVQKADTRPKPAETDSPSVPAGRAALHVIRPAIMSAVIRTHRPQSMPVTPLLKGQVAALVYPLLDPPALSSLLLVIDRTSPPRRPNSPPPTPEDATRPRISIMAGLIDGTVLLEEAVRSTAKLPSLDMLRAQIIGILSRPASQLAGVLDAARGGRAVHMLDSYRQGLEDGSQKAGE